MLWLALAMGRDGVVPTPEVVEEARAAACEAGDAAACGEGDCDALGGTACLREAWSMLRRVDAELDPATAPEPERYRKLVEKACADGVTRGCTEVGILQHRGIGTFAGTRRARLLWEPACEAGEARACTELGRLDDDRDRLERAAELGDASASWSLGDIEAACEAGHLVSCRIDEERLAWACGAGDAEACVLEAVRAGLPTTQWCPESERACAEARWRSADPVFDYTGTLLPVQLTRGLFDHRVPLHDCLLDALDRDTDAGGPLRTIWRIDADGTVPGAWVVDPIDADHAACVEEELATARFEVLENPMWVDMRLGAWHQAKVSLRTTEGRLGEARQRELARDLTHFGDAFDRCYLDAGETAAGVQSKLTFLTGHSGRIRKVVFIGSLAPATVDDCIVDVLEQHVLSAPPVGPAQMELTVTFVEPGVGSAGRGKALPIYDPSDGETVPIRLLALIVERTEVGWDTVRFRKREIAAIRAQHELHAKEVAEASGGRLVIDFDVHVMDAVMPGVTRYELSDEREVSDGPAHDTPVVLTDQRERWEAGPGMLPDEAWTAIEPSAYDIVIAWAPLPDAVFPWPEESTTWNETLRGATVSTALMSEGRRLEELLDHAWSGQLEMRADRIEGVDYIGDIHNQHPDLWPAILGLRGSTPPGDLGAAARPDGHGVDGIDGLNDGVLELPGFDVRSEPLKSANDDLWFGLTWPEPVELTRIEAVMDAPGPVMVELVGLDDQPVEIGAAKPANGRLVATFERARVIGVRLRPLDWLDYDTDPFCIEIDAFAD